MTDHPPHPAGEKTSPASFAKDPAEGPAGPSAEKPFALAKYFSTIAIVIIFAASLTLAAVVSRRAEEIVNSRVEDDTVMLMENLTHQMFLRFQVPMALERGGVHLRDPDQHQLLHSVVLNTIHGFDVSRVLIYNLEGQIVYSTEPDDLENFADDMPAYLEALSRKALPPLPAAGEARPAPQDEREILLNRLRAEAVNKRIGNYLLGSFFPRGTFVIRSFKAMETYGTDSLTGVLELRRDLTPEYHELAKLQFFALSFAVFITLLLTLVLRMVVSRGARIIDQKNRERRKLQEQLDQAERLAGLGSMVATVAHEIRNPLGIIHSTAELLKSLQNPEEARLAGAIVEEADRLSEVVTEFLDFARPQAPRPAPVVIEDLLEEILAFLEVTTARAGVEVRVHFRAEAPPTMADAAMLHRAFLNLLINAIQAMPEGGLLSLATLAEGDFLKITITDTGPGLSSEAAARIFSPFYTTKAKGSGLGLVIARNIIHSHGGELTLTSRAAAAEGETSGLTAAITLPRRPVSDHGKNTSS